MASSKRETNFIMKKIHFIINRKNSPIQYPELELQAEHQELYTKTLHLIKNNNKQNYQLEWELYRNQLKPVFLMMKLFGSLPMEITKGR